jgi:hypothetical protein
MDNTSNSKTLFLHQQTLHPSENNTDTEICPHCDLEEFEDSIRKLEWLLPIILISLPSKTLKPYYVISLHSILKFSALLTTTVAASQFILWSSVLPFYIARITKTNLASLVR